MLRPVWAGLGGWRASVVVDGAGLLLVVVVFARRIGPIARSCWGCPVLKCEPVAGLLDAMAPGLFCETTPGRFSEAASGAVIGAAAGLFVEAAPELLSETAARLFVEAAAGLFVEAVPGLFVEAVPGLFVEAVPGLFIETAPRLFIEAAPRLFNESPAIKRCAVVAGDLAPSGINVARGVRRESTDSVGMLLTFKPVVDICWVSDAVLLGWAVVPGRVVPAPGIPGAGAAPCQRCISAIGRCKAASLGSNSRSKYWLIPGPL
jgi:hypothetical protein